MLTPKEADMIARKTIGVLAMVIMWPQIVLVIPGLISPEFLK